MVSITPNKRRKSDATDVNDVEVTCKKSMPLPEVMFKEMRLRRLVRENHGKAILQLAFHMDENKQNILATIGDNQANIYDNEHGKDHLDILSHYVHLSDDGVSSGSLNTCCWLKSKDDALLAVGGQDQSINILSIAHSKAIQRLEGHSGAVIHLVAHPTQAHLLLSVGDDKTVRLWDIQTESCISLYETGRSLTVAAIHESGEKFVVGTQSGEIYEWPITVSSSLIRKESGTLLSKKLHSCPIDCISYKDNNIISKSINGKIEYWNPSLGKPLKSITVRNAENHKSKFDISFDKEFLAVGNSIGECFIYHITTGKLIHELHAKRAKSPITSCQFSSDCRNIVFADQDTMIWRFDYIDSETLEKWDRLKKAAATKENKDDSENA